MAPLVVPGRIRPSAGGVRSTPSVTVSEVNTPAAGRGSRLAGGELERADSHVQLKARERAPVPDRAGIDLTGDGFEFVDDFQRPYLRSAGHRAGREGGADEVTVASAIAEGAADFGH